MGGRGAGKLSLDWKLAKVSCPLFQQLKTPSSKRPAKGQWVRIDSFVLSVAVVAVVHVAAIFCVVIVFLFLVFNELSVNIRSCAVDWFMSLASVLLLCAAAFFNCSCVCPLAYSIAWGESVKAQCHVACRASALQKDA